MAHRCGAQPKVKQSMSAALAMMKFRGGGPCVRADIIKLSCKARRETGDQHWMMNSESCCLFALELVVYMYTKGTQIYLSVYSSCKTLSTQRD